MFVAKRFIRSLVEKYGQHQVYTDRGSWCIEAYHILRLKHYLHSPFEKSLIERVNQYFKPVRYETNLTYFFALSKEY